MNSNTNVSAMAYAGVAAVCSAVVVFQAVTFFTAPADTSLYAPAMTATPPSVAAMPAAQMPAHRAATMQRAAKVAAAADAEVRYAQEVPLQMPAQSMTWAPFAALMAIPTAVAALFFAIGRSSASAPTVQPMDMEYGSVAMAATTSRRQMLASLPVVAGAMMAQPALAGAPKGFKVQRDPYDGYQFLYPFGWQEVSVDGQDVLFKDIIEPLETVSVAITLTDKKSVTELGDVKETCFTIADNFLTSRNQDVTLLDAKLESEDGIDYYTMEFTAKAPAYTRHALATIAICNGKLYTCVTGCNEKRWKKVETVARTVVGNFSVFKVVRAVM